MSAPLVPARLIPAKWRKLIGSLGILAFLAVYVWAFTSLYDFLPQNRLLHLVYFLVVGLGWGLPLVPLLSWMGKADKRL